MQAFFNKILKIKNLLLAIFILLLLLLAFTYGHVYAKNELSYGVTFSKKQAIDLGLDWQKAFTAALDDLKIKRFRLVAYWDQIENADGTFNWSDLDWQIEQASERQAEMILAVGARLPRWPECHLPVWSLDMSKEQREAKILDYIEQTVKRYRGNRQVIAWQVENEPFLSHFGECPTLDPAFLDQEIALVRQLDSRPVVVTDSGELSLWVPAAKRADIFGTTMYRNTYSSFLNSYIRYPLTPAFFRFKKNLAKLFAEPKDWLVIELQAEPWGKIPYQFLSQAERDQTMDLQKFKDILEYARQAGFKEFYLWGVEWWYWEKEVNHRPEFWEEARTLF